MDNNEMMENQVIEEAVDATEEIAESGMSSAAKIGVGIGLAVLIGSLGYKFIVKPLQAKYKAYEQNVKDTVAKSGTACDEDEPEDEDPE